MKKLLKFMAILMIVFGLPTTAKALTNADDLVGANGWIYTYLAHQDTVTSTGEYSLSSSGYYDNNYIWISTMFSSYRSIHSYDLSIYDSVFIEFTSANDYDSIPLGFSVGSFNYSNPKNIKSGKNVIKFQINNLIGQINVAMINCNKFTDTINANISFAISDIGIYFHGKNETSSILHKSNRILTKNPNSININKNHINIKYNGLSVLGNR